MLLLHIIEKNKRLLTELNQTEDTIDCALETPFRIFKRSEAENSDRINDEMVLEEESSMNQRLII